MGVVSGVPSLIALPLGLWLADRVGYGPVAVTGGLAAPAAIAFVLGLPNRTDHTDHSEQPLGVVQGLRTGALLRPVLVFAATAPAAGIVVTFLPLAVPSASTGVIATALFVQTAASTLTRWLAGRLGDRHGSARLTLPGLLLSAAGVLVVAPTANPVSVVAGTAIFGAGFGITQNATRHRGGPDGLPVGVHADRTVDAGRGGPGAPGPTNTRRTRVTSVPGSP